MTLLPSYPGLARVYSTPTILFEPEDSRPDEVIQFFSIYLILPAALGRGVYSASNRNKFQKRKEIVSGEKSEAGAHG
jgi:hypothetical protein